MVKIGAKLVKNQKTKLSTTYVNINEYDSKNFYNYLVLICRDLDIAVPLVLDYHKSNYEKFNFVKFKQDDFVDKIDFDFLLLENEDRE